MGMISVSDDSKKLWESYKNHPGESFEEMINRIIKTVYEDDDELLNDKDILDIEKSIQQIKSGKFMTNENLKKKYGI